MTDELKECRESFEKWMEKTQPFHAQGTRGMAMWEAYQDAWQQSRTKPEGVDIAAELAARSHLRRAIEHIETAIKVTAKE